MTDDICGAETTKGTPCQNPAGSCPWHGSDETPDTKKSKLERNPEILDLAIDEIMRGATVGEALAEVEEKTGVYVDKSTHRNWLAMGKDDTNAEIYKDYRTGLTHARKRGKRHDRNTIKQRAMDEGDLRLWWKIHMQQYGNEYETEEEDNSDMAPPFAIPESLIEQWQQQTPTPQ